MKKGYGTKTGVSRITGQKKSPEALSYCEVIGFKWISQWLDTLHSGTND